MLLVQEPGPGGLRGPRATEGLARPRGPRTEDKKEVNNNTETEAENRSGTNTECWNKTTRQLVGENTDVVWLVLMMNGENASPD